MSYRNKVLSSCPTFYSDPPAIRISRGILGLASEAGELVNSTIGIIHGNYSIETQRPQVIKDLGDIYWYLEYLSECFGVSTKQIQYANIKKIKDREKQKMSLDNDEIQGKTKAEVRAERKRHKRAKRKDVRVRRKKKGK